MFQVPENPEETIVKIEIKMEEGFSSEEDENDYNYNYNYESLNIKVEGDMIVKKEEYQENEEDIFIKQEVPLYTTQTSKKESSSRPKSLPGIKNVVKNYGKAMCTFAYSDIAEPYLAPLLKKEQITREEFIEWIQNNKERVDGIERLRGLLLVSPQDEPLLASYKRVFQKISETFLKYFCVNWIYGGKLTHRETHLSVMFKMQRRVKNPELFTYLHSARKRKS